MTRILKGHIQRMTHMAGREVIFLNSAMTAAREIARCNGISYQRYDNTFLEVQRMAEVKKLRQRFYPRVQKTRDEPADALQADPSRAAGVVGFVARAKYGEAPLK